MILNQLRLLFQLQDGKPSLDNSIALVQKMHPGNDKAVEITKKLHSDCDGVSDADRCENAFKIVKCLKESMAAQGLNFDDDM